MVDASQRTTSDLNLPKNWSSGASDFSCTSAMIATSPSLSLAATVSTSVACASAWSVLPVLPTQAPTPAPKSMPSGPPRMPSTEPISVPVMVSSPTFCNGSKASTGVMTPFSFFTSAAWAMRVSSFCGKAFSSTKAW